MRFVIEGLMLVDTWIHNRWDVGCFILGLVTAELHVRSQSMDPDFGKESSSLLQNPDFDTSTSSEPILGSRSKNLGSQKLATYGLYAMFIMGLYLGSFPTVGGCQTPGFAPLCALTFQVEPWRYIMLPAGFLVVMPVLFLPMLQRPLISGPARYLGKVSYAM